MNYDFYNGLAYKQQVGEVEIPVARGTIFSSTGDGTVLSTSVELNDIAIDPKITGNKEKLGEYLTNLAYKELCYLQKSSICYNNLLKYLKRLEIEDYVFEENYIKGLLSEKIIEKISQTRVTSVLVTQDVETETASLIFAQNLPGVYVNEGNIYVNPEEVVDESRVTQVFSQLL